MTDGPVTMTATAPRNEMLESKTARAFRSALNANGEFGSAFGSLSMALATPIMLEPSVSRWTIMILPDKAQSFFDVLSILFALIGIWQLWAVLSDRRGKRIRAAWFSSVVWACATSAFFSIHFFGAVSLSIAMIVVNMLAAARGKLQVQEWERFGCTRAGTCDRRVPSRGFNG